MSAKHKGVGPQAVTANTLRDGMNVWLTEKMVWSEDFAEALKTEDADLIAEMQKVADSSEDANIVVAAYFIDIEPDTGRPVRYREKFRVSGPTHDQSQYPSYKSS